MQTLCVVFLLLATVVALPATNVATLVNLRVEGRTETIYEGPILTRGHNVTTASGGDHPCDGTNLNANPSPGPTCTSALDSASKLPLGLAHFTFDGTFFPDFDDFLITRIGPDIQTDVAFWSLLLNNQFAPVGGCQQEVRRGDDVLWAFDAFSKQHFLQLAGPEFARVGESVVVTVTDGSQPGVLIEGATVGKVQTGADGTARVRFDSPGVKRLKAERKDSVRSNALWIVARP